MTFLKGYNHRKDQATRGHHRLGGGGQEEGGKDGIHCGWGLCGSWAALQWGRSTVAVPRLYIAS